MCGESFKGVEEKIRAYRHGRKENPMAGIGPGKIWNLAEELSADVIGQPKGGPGGSRVVTRAAAGMAACSTPPPAGQGESFFWRGPTGTRGKTELAKSWPERFSARRALIEI